MNMHSVRHGTKKLVEKIDEFNPDVIHLHGLHGYYVNLPILINYINSKDIPCLLTFHDCFLFSGKCGYHYECEQWKTGCEKCMRTKDYPNSMFFDFTKYMWRRKKELFSSSNSKIIVSPSQWMTNDAKQSFFGAYECITVNNGIDIDTVFYYRGKSESRKKHGYSDDEKIVLGIAFGFDDPRKGVKYIIKLAEDLKQYNDVRVILIVWNDKNDHLIAKLPNIDTLPFTYDQNELAEYYSLADVFILTSLAENYATVVLEALACGTPVVGFNVGGTAEQLAEGRGLVVEPKNSEQILDAVLHVLNGTAKLANKEQLIEFTRNNNSIRVMTDKYEKIYKLLNDKQV